MYRLSYDLHIHSCLSPCGSDESTPANIALLADMLELDIVALTDHNTCKNCPAFFEIAKNLNFIAIAGMELNVSEEIHILCLFPELENAMEFDKYISKQIMPIENNTKLFGNQLIMNVHDDIIGTEKYNLLNAAEIDLYTLSTLIKKYEGIIIPAHIDRSSYSLISSLGIIPDDCGFNCVEIRYKEAEENLKAKHSYLNKCRIVYDSDAHILENISLPQNFIECEEKNAKSVLKALSKQK